MTFNGSTGLDDTRLQLTNGGTNQAGSAFFNTPVNVQSFTTDFTFQLSNAGADGITFTIQGNGPTALGPYGGGLGYGPATPGGTGGIPNSVAVKLDTFNNAGEGIDSTGLYKNGSSPTTPNSIDLTPSGIDLHSNDTMSVDLAYDGTTLSMLINDPVANKTFSTSWAIDIPRTVGGPTAYVGFTGGTGGETSSQKIGTWALVSSSGQATTAPLLSPAAGTYLGTRPSPLPILRQVLRSSTRWMEPRRLRRPEVRRCLHRTYHRDRHGDYQCHRDCAGIYNEHGNQRFVHHRVTGRRAIVLSRSRNLSDQPDRDDLNDFHWRDDFLHDERHDPYDVFHRVHRSHPGQLHDNGPSDCRGQRLFRQFRFERHLHDWFYTAAATPTFSPAAGTYTSTQNVTISDATPSAAIYYTTDGTLPTTGSTLYVGAIAVSLSETIKAIAMASGYSNSAVLRPRTQLLPRQHQTSR